MHIADFLQATDILTGLLGIDTGNWYCDLQVFKQGYGDGSMAPGVLGIGTTAYISAHNQVNQSLATALGWINIVVAF